MKLVPTKPLALAAIISSLVVSSSFATITIEWKASFGVDDPAVPGTTFDLPIGSLVQLIWSPDNAIDAFDDLNPTTTTGNDVVLDNRNTSITGAYAFTDTFDGTNDSLPEDTYVSGYVYHRVFNTGAPADGDYYGISGLIGGSLTDQDPTSSTPDASDLAPSSLFTLSSQITAIPEPSAIAMMMLGTASLLIVRGTRRS